MTAPSVGWRTVATWLRRRLNAFLSFIPKRTKSLYGRQRLRNGCTNTSFGVSASM